jgi:single-strand DNA-binding protein
MSLNKAILIGNVGNDPEVRHLDAGTPVANFRLATSESYKNREGERITQTEWHSIVVWRGLAEVVEKYVHKGQQLYIEGRIRTRAWEDKDGNKRYTTEIVADNLQLLGRKSDGASESYGGGNQEVSQPSADSTSTASEPEPEDDLPF